MGSVRGSVRGSTHPHARPAASHKPGLSIPTSPVEIVENHSHYPYLGGGDHSCGRPLRHASPHIRAYPHHVRPAGLRRGRARLGRQGRARHARTTHQARAASTRYLHHPGRDTRVSRSGRCLGEGLSPGEGGAILMAHRSAGRTTAKPSPFTCGTRSAHRHRQRSREARRPGTYRMRPGGIGVDQGHGASHQAATLPPGQPGTVPIRSG